MALTQAQADSICDRLAAGESLRAIVKGGGYLSLSGTYASLDRDFAEQYARARLDQAEAYAARCIEVAEQEPVTYVTSDAAGNIAERVDSGEVQHRRLLIDTLKWTAAHLKPKTWGDKALEVTGPNGGPIQVITGVPTTDKP